MRSNTPVDSLIREDQASSPQFGRDGTARPCVSASEFEPAHRPRPISAIARDPDDTGVEFLLLYRRLLSEIESWCKPSGAPITQVIRRQALRDYVEVYCHTYPRQPSYPFPPRFGRYVAYLDGFDDIVEAIDSWCEWLSRQFLPGVVPIHLIRSALDEWDENRRIAEQTHAPALRTLFAPMPARRGPA